MIYNQDASEESFDKHFNTIDKRADFFSASDEYEKNVGIGAKWFGGAEFVSRAPLTGLGADGNGSQYTFSVGRLFAPVYDWRDEAGNTLINSGFENFKSLYNQEAKDPVNWDINQLQSEQKALQSVHEKYLKDADTFNLIGNIVTDSDHLLGVGSKLHLGLTSDEQGISGGVNILEYDSRVEFGCKLLDYTADIGCKP